MTDHDDDPRYLSGFANHHATEAVPGALPVGQNSPQRAPLGLYAEQLSGTAFTQPRAVNRRTWAYRILPSARHEAFSRIGNGRLLSAPIRDAEPDPNRLRWNPPAIPAEPTDFVQSLFTVGANGDVLAHTGVAVHVYCCNQSMTDKYFVNADGEMLLVPQSGVLTLATELGRLIVAPGEIAVIPRGIRFRVDLHGEHARGYVLENYGAMLTLPERGPIGANGLANERDFLAPTAWYEERAGALIVVQKYGGNLWAAPYDHSPLDVVAWHGNYYPYKYDLGRFMAVGSISFDHPDPSIFTVLTSPSDSPGLANADFVIFPPRWLVAENTYRPPWFHRNVMTEYMGLVHGEYDAKADGFLPGGGSLHNMFTSHGNDADTFEAASSESQHPRKVDDTMAFMFETRLPLHVAAQALTSAGLQKDYDSVWHSLGRQFSPHP